MKKRFDQRKLTLVLGILVAVIVILMLWSTQKTTEALKKSDHQESVSYIFPIAIIKKSVGIVSLDSYFERLLRASFISK